MFDKATNTHPPTIKFVPKCYKTQEMCDKAVNGRFFCFDWYKTQQMGDKVVSEHPFLIAYCPVKYLNSENVG